MIKIRLARGGVKNNPFYRIIAIEHSRKRSGKPLDILGFWNPSKNESSVDKKKLADWIGKGAKVTKVVDDIIKKK